jgi:hypothetical protein
MKKSTITRTWIAGLVVLAAGLVLAGVSCGLMLAYGGTFTHVAGSNAYNFNPNFDGFFWTMVGLMITGAFLALAGGIVQLAAWIGAVLNSYRLPDKTWFAIVLAGGVFGLAFGLIGFVAMVAYLISAPDGMALAKPQASVPGARPTSFLPTT